GLIGFSGWPDRDEQQLALLEPLAPAYGDDWWFLSSLAFAYEELDRFDEARALSERSLELHHRNGHAAHVLAHVVLEGGAAPAGGPALGGWPPGDERAAQRHSLTAWPRALFPRARGAPCRGLHISGRDSRPGTAQTAALAALADADWFLGRCDLYG